METGGVMASKQSGKRSHGDGSVYFDKGRNRWVAEFTVEMKRRRVTAATKTDALARMRSRMAEVEGGLDVEDRNLRVSDVVDRFISRTVPNRKGGSLAPSTRAVHEWAGKRISEGLGSKRVSALTVRHVERFLDGLSAEGMSRASVVKVRSTLRMALEESVKRREVIVNVAQSADLPPDLRPAEQRFPLVPSEVPRFIRAVEDDRLGAMWLLMVRMGLRWEEAAGIHWDALDGSTLLVRHTIRRNRGRSEVSSEMKNQHSRRILELPSDVLEAIHRHRRQQAEERLAADVWLYPGMMFTTPRGGLLDPVRSRRDLVRLCTESEVTVPDPNGPRPPRPHELRHTAADMMRRAGIPLEQIAAILGQSSTRMLQSFYHHPTGEPLRTVVDRDWLPGITQTG